MDMDNNSSGTWTGETPEELEKWLKDEADIDTTLYGSGQSKSVAQLCEEVQLGESQLRIVDGKASRVVSVLNVFVLDNYGRVLYEEKQIQPSGVVRERNLPLSEKLKGDEDWQEAIPRAVSEELGSILPGSPQIKVLTETYKLHVTSGISDSYPGLQTQYRCHRVQARVADLPTTERFISTEPRPDGTLQNHWIWRECPTETAQPPLSDT